jgi:hypothetical protein
MRLNKKSLVLKNNQKSPSKSHLLGSIFVQRTTNAILRIEISFIVQKADCAVNRKKGSKPTSLVRRCKKTARRRIAWRSTTQSLLLIPEIDHWFRRRMRMCYWKQWRYCRTRVRNLLKLWVKANITIPMSLSRKGLWKMARTLATQTGMTNQWLKDQGLISVKDQ